MLCYFDFGFFSLLSMYITRRFTDGRATRLEQLEAALFKFALPGPGFGVAHNLLKDHDVELSLH